jgi:hypothetical protein
MAIPVLRTLFLALAISALLASFCRAGYGRQTLIVEADYEYASVCRWIERNVDAIQKSSGAQILESHASVVTVQIETKYGTQTFVFAAGADAATTGSRFSTDHPARRGWGALPAHLPQLVQDC